MAFVIKDRVRETTATTGTGTVTLAGAVSGYQSFSAIGNGNTTYYCIAGQGTNEWEVGIGTYTSAGTTLSRTTVLSSSNSGSLVPFSAGTKDVFVTQPASRAVFQDDLLDASTGNNFNAVSYNGGQLAGFRNKIINGAMQISQRYNAPLTASIFSTSGPTFLDRWKRLASYGAGNATYSQEIDAPSSEPNLYYSFRVVTATAVTYSNAAYYMQLLQPIEGYNARELANTTFTLSFWVKATKTGTYCVNFKNASDRTYIAEYTISASNTWEYKTITVSGGLPASSGTWDWTNGNGVSVGFVIFCGPDRQVTTPGTWLSSPYASPSAPFATTNQVNGFDTIGNIFAITGVQVEVGTVATPFESRLFNTELTLCQRYYEKSFDYGTAPAQNTGTTNGALYAVGQVTNQLFGGTAQFKVTKRTSVGATNVFYTTYAPDAATSNWSTAGGNTPTVQNVVYGDNAISIGGGTGVTAGTGYYIHWVASAEL
jgi:hypothetical protein